MSDDPGRGMDSVHTMTESEINYYRRGTRDICARDALRLLATLDASRAREASLKAALAKAEGERDRSIIEERDTAETMVKVEDRAIAAEARASEAVGLLREVLRVLDGDGWTPYAGPLHSKIDAFLHAPGRKGER